MRISPQVAAVNALGLFFDTDMAKLKFDAEKIKTAICERIANGEPLKPICREEGMPSFHTIYNWIDKDAKFAARMEKAREMGADAIADGILEIADDARNDWVERLDNEQVPIGYQLNGDHVQRSKLRIETRLKLLAKWHPKKYGDKLELGGSVEGFALVINPARPKA